MSSLLTATASPPERLLEPGEMRLSELLSALSVALDITEGQPEGHAVRTCLIGMRIAEQIGLSSEERSPLFYALLLKDLGCSSNASKMCALFGADDRRIKKDVKEINWAKATECLKFSTSHVAPEGSTVQKVMRMAALAIEGSAGAKKLVEIRCERGADIARMLQFPEAAAQAIRNLDEHWNGQGHPDGLRGEEIPLLARIANLAQTFEVFFSKHGLAAAMDVVANRRGTWFDPFLADACAGLKSDTVFWARLAGATADSNLSDLEPRESIILVDEDRLDQVAAAFAQVVDAKSPWTHKHSEGVSTIAVGIAGVLGYSPIMQRDIRRAGLLHDLGKLGVSNMILDKPGRPTDEEFIQIRKHPDYSEQILRRVANFQRLADVAASHHERLDGRGYHRRLPNEDFSQQGRILAVADIFEALSAKRPYRDEMPREKIFEIMNREAGPGICPDSLAALKVWLDRNEVTSRVEAQLDQIDAALSSLAG